MGCVVVVNDLKTNWQQSGVPGGLILELILFIVFISSLDDGLAYTSQSSARLWMASVWGMQLA